MKRFDKTDAETQGYGQFDDNIVTEKTPLVALNATLPLSKLRDIQSTYNGGTISDNASEFALKSSTSATNGATVVSSERGRYQPGTIMEVGIGTRLNKNELGTGQKAVWGYFDNTPADKDTRQISDGIYFELDEGTLYAVIRKGGTDQVRVPQSQWNLDNSSLDLTKGSIFKIDYSYYGYGIVVFQIVLTDSRQKQKVLDLHSEVIDGSTSMDKSNMNVGGKIYSTNNSDPVELYLGGRQISIQGRFNPKKRVTTQEREAQSVGTSYEPLMNLQKKAGFEAVPIDFFAVDIITDQDLIVELRIDSTLTGASFKDIADTDINETVLQYDEASTDIDRTTGVKIDQFVVSAGSGNAKGFRGLSNSFPFPEGSVINLVAKSIGNTATVTSIIKATEEF